MCYASCMTGRTHDLAAFTALTYIMATKPLDPISLPTVAVALTANFLGALAPDLDQSTSSFWGKIRGGSYFGKLIAPVLGGHRFISHSILGVLIAGFLVDKLLILASGFLIVDMTVVWWAFMIGFVSHLVMDTLTKEGVPWLFPIPIKIGFPPLYFLRVTTGGKIEKYLIFPSLLLANAYLFYTYYPKFLELIKYYLK